MGEAMNRTFWTGLALAAALSPSNLAAQEAPGCELHVWPSDRIGAVDKDNHSFMAGGLSLTSTFTTYEDVGQSLAAALPSSSQAEVMASFPFDHTEQLAGYEIIIHSDEVTPQEYAFFHLDGVGEGARLSDSASPCYAELHTILVTYLDQPMKDVL